VTHDQEEAFAMADRIGIMNHGRLLEIGVPHELYSRPATRFVATFLGAANLLLARRTADGIQMGENTVAAAEHAADMSEQEVVAVVRPEEVELAAAREALSSGFLARGVVDEIAFTGALESLRVRIEAAAHTPLLAQANGAAGAHLQVTRTQHERRGFAVRPGQQVAIGVRRVHVLPTPLSSFTACAENKALAETLAQQPLLAELAARMKTRIALRVEPQLGVADGGCASAEPFVGTTAISAPAHGARRAEWLLQRGSKDLLLLPPQAALPQRVLIHWMSETARAATLAVSASVLRHVAAEAVYVGIFPGESAQAQGMRELLDARSEAQLSHGLEMRTELGFGDVASELTRRLAAGAAPMLILGVSELSRSAAPLQALLDSARWPVLLVYRAP
jgi:hypothetical protein